MSKIIKWLLLSTGVLLIGYIGYFVFSTYSGLSHFHKTDKNSVFDNVEKNNLKNNVPTPPVWQGTERVNILMLGGDSRGLGANEVPRSDSIIVISIDPTTKKAVMFSVLRDTYVEIKGHDNNKINAALAFGGPTLAMDTVGKLIGLPIQYYVYTDFKGFIGVIDAVGGLDFYVEKDMNYTDGQDGHVYDIHLKQGMQHLDGKTALEYVRFRHDALSDFARSDRQRNFLQALASKLQTPASFLKIPQILSAIDPYIETNMSVSDMLKLGYLAYSSKASGIISEQIPPNNLLKEGVINGADVVETNPVNVQQFVQEQLTASLSATPSPQPSATVLPSAAANAY